MEECVIICNDIMRNKMITIDESKLVLSSIYNENIITHIDEINGKYKINGHVKYFEKLDIYKNYFNHEEKIICDNYRELIMNSKEMDENCIFKIVIEKNTTNFFIMYNDLFVSDVDNNLILSNKPLLWNHDDNGFLYTIGDNSKYLCHHDNELILVDKNYDNITQWNMGSNNYGLKYLLNFVNQLPKYGYIREDINGSKNNPFYFLTLPFYWQVNKKYIAEILNHIYGNNLYYISSLLGVHISISNKYNKGMKMNIDVDKKIMFEISGLDCPIIITKKYSTTSDNFLLGTVVLNNYSLNNVDKIVIKGKTRKIELGKFPFKYAILLNNDDKNIFTDIEKFIILEINSEMQFYKDLQCTYHDNRPRCHITLGQYFDFAKKN